MLESERRFVVLFKPSVIKLSCLAIGPQFYHFFDKKGFVHDAEKNTVAQVLYEAPRVSDFDGRTAQQSAWVVHGAF